MLIFSDLTNEFQILDFSATHNQLLIRSMRNRKRDFNIDIIFKMVHTLIIPASIKGIEISKDDKLDEKKQLLIDEFKFIITNDYKVFSVKNSEGIIYYINAMSFGVYKNKLDILETSLGRYDMGNLGELVQWFAD